MTAAAAAAAAAGAWIVEMRAIACRPLVDGWIVISAHHDASAARAAALRVERAPGFERWRYEVRWGPRPVIGGAS